MCNAMSTRPHVVQTAQPQLHSTATQYGAASAHPTLGEWRYPGRFALLCILRAACLLSTDPSDDLQPRASAD